MRIIAVAAGAALVASCGNSPTQSAKAEPTAATLDPGEYELAWTDIKFAPSEKAEASSTQADVKAALPKRACVASGGAIDPAAFASKGEKCHSVNSYARNGIINVQFSCEQDAGRISQMASGTFAADSFDAEVETTTSFTQVGNYTLKAKVNATRVGQCAAGNEAAKGA